MKDERLLLLTLKNIPIAFGIQTLGIIAILVYNGIKYGFWSAHNNPLWLVFIGTSPNATIFCPVMVRVIFRSIPLQSLLY
ncbi:hypothetical protein [Heyndrickxia acidiproducens]|uniref:hypothetical protein n=1 Tax=Heyndrickxia acidiproducens TaxID=1121084 RepID=UPI000685AD8B|nr:hypothetical protein [Heyndrickxia acidiproducens]